jgi:AP2-associated kinase
MHTRSPPIAHRDIKIENVLMFGKTFKLCDFGSATSDTLDPKKDEKNYILSEFSKYEKTTTFMYRPPEMCDMYSKYQVNTQVDIWMLGCIMYTLMFKKHPFQDAQKLTIINAHYYVPEDNSYSEKLTDFMRLMLTPNPANRPNIKTILNYIGNWGSIKEIELPEETIEIKEKHSKKNDIKNTKSDLLSGDDIWRIQQQILNDQKKKKRRNYQKDGKNKYL